MRRVIPLELVGLKNYDHDLYDENGKVIYSKGDPLSSEFLMALNFKKIYRTDDIPAMLAKTEEKPKTDSLISDSIAEELVNSTKEIYKTLYEGGDKLNSIVCEKASVLIVNEVKEKLKLVEYISQLKIYDDYLYSHAVNVSILSTAIGMALELDKKSINDLALGALLHDVGKTRIPLEILNKPGRLTPEEFMVIMNHSALGYDILTTTGLPENIAKIALEHHERANGEGYPHGLKEKNISLMGQIVAIADVYDALTSDRVYKSAMMSSEALRIMLLDGANAFNMRILNIFAYLAVIDISKQGRMF